MEFSKFQWSLWANEQGVVSCIALLIGAVVAFTGDLKWWGIAIFVIIVAPVFLLVEWPRGRLRGKTRSVHRPLQHLFPAIPPETRPGKLFSSYFFRSLLYFLASLPGLFLGSTVIGSLLLICCSLSYFVAAWNGEKWELGEEYSDKKSGPVAPPLSNRLLPDGKPFEISDPLGTVDLNI